MIELITLDQIAPQPWRNGGGTTRELLTWPREGAWSVRISVADINVDGPFSAFPGVSRWFAVLQGSGVQLRFGSDTQTLTRDSLPFSFDGAAAPGCDLLDGPTRDLNLMIRSEAGYGSMMPARAGVEWRSRATFRAVFVTGPATLVADQAESTNLPAMALAYNINGPDQSWSLRRASESTVGWWLSFEAIMTNSGVASCTPAGAT